jgi:hypothetical protein
MARNPIGPNDADDSHGSGAKLSPEITGLTSPRPDREARFRLYYFAAAPSV